jgi:hypothetical protein
VQGGCPFEIQLLAGFLALFFNRRPERSPARFQETRDRGGS